MISFVYDPSYRKNNSDFWSHLVKFGEDYDVPWLCIGDFNAITTQSNKLGGRPFNCSYSNIFSSFLNKFGMIDLGFSDNPYTWFNNLQGHSLIKERLDRGFASNQWIHFFPSFSITLLPAHNSDHNPLLLDIAIITPFLPRPFRFEEFWSRDPTCGIVINEAWSIDVTGSPTYYLSVKSRILNWLSNFGINIILLILEGN
jgi:hypothetical protein